MNKNTTRILCQVNENVICELLNVPENFPGNPEVFSEETLVQLYRECNSEVKNVFLSEILKTGHSVENLVLPLNVNIFWEEVQPVLSMLSKILGYDDDKFVAEVMLGFLSRTNLSHPESNKACCLILDEFLATTIHA